MARIGGRLRVLYRLVAQQPGRDRAEPRAGTQRWSIATLLFIATLINYIDRQTLSVLAPVLRDEFQLSNTDYSRIVFAFLLAYMIMQAGSGRIMDWLGTKKGFSLTICWWSAATMLHAAATSGLSLGGFRFLLGLGQAGNWPGGVKAVSEWFPPKQRAFAIGFWNSGSTFGAVVAPPLVAWIALQWGWRSAFLITGALGFFWLIGWLGVYGKPVRTWEESASSERIRWRDLWRIRQVWGLVLARMLADPVWWFYVFWLPEYLKRERDFSLAMIGLFAWIPFLAAAAGSLTGGLLSGRIARRRPLIWSRKVVMCFSAIFMMAGIPAVLAGDAAVALGLISLATFAYSTWAANILTLPADLFPQQVVASVSGLSGTGAALGGMMFMLAIGSVVDRFSYVPVFTAAGIMPLIAAAFILGLVRTEQRPGFGSGSPVSM